MGSTHELSLTWDRLDAEELRAVQIIAESKQMATVSRKLRQFLASCVESEANHREFLATKRQQVPNWDEWSDLELAFGYQASVMVERACEPHTERLRQWSELLRKAVCNEMASRLEVRHIMTGS